MLKRSRLRSVLISVEGKKTPAMGGDIYGRGLQARAAECKIFSKIRGLKHELAILYMPQHSYMARYVSRTLLDKVASCWLESTSPKFFECNWLRYTYGPLAHLQHLLNASPGWHDGRRSLGREKLRCFLSSTNTASAALFIYLSRLFDTLSRCLDAHDTTQTPDPATVSDVS